MSKIPEARRRLAELKQRTRSPDMAAEIEDIIGLMIRRPYARGRAPDRSRAVDETLAERIRRYAHAHPKMSQQEIAVHFGTNAGRVSEALHHDR
ncbi:hypothetical protein [Pseudoroseomonas ludipueritiae]|uniref:RNA polymerase sigma-70 region 4 domain-containing protein n=1 Tax=Pseudoroseomonas ludipueritiae TaxID=198093 RepID=A0ABR7R4F1_9PROT|nr:hypothetical protein [Pseudoroseomonas ludipueritiae]MBC9176649.1 hypothetical protein [Pseudoroseomonas ludipueritiae]